MKTFSESIMVIGPLMLMFLFMVWNRVRTDKKIWKALTKNTDSEGLKDEK